VTLAYLGIERFGLWMTISSLQTFLVFADLGIGNGVLNAVADASGRRHTREMQASIESGLLLLGSISLVILFLLASTYHWLHPGPFVGVRSGVALREAGPAFAAFGICFAVDVTGSLIQRIQLGLQLGFLSSLWQIAGSVLAVLGLLLAIEIRASLPILVLAFCGPPVLTKFVNGYFFFVRVRPDLRPKFRSASWGATKNIGRLAILFLVLNLAVALAFQSDNLIIAHILGPEAVAQYSVPQKLFGLITLVMATLIEPLWPAYGEAIGRGDGGWVQKTLIRSLILTVICASLLGVSFTLAGPRLIHLWVGDKIHASSVLLIGLAFWAVIQAGGNAVAMFLNGASVIKPQIMIAIAFAGCALLIKIRAVEHWGVDVMPWATLISYSVLNVLPYAIIVPGIVSKVCNPRLAVSGTIPAEP
jgi:O-antigen/teichoic acid export membrane protein